MAGPNADYRAPGLSRSQPKHLLSLRLQLDAQRRVAMARAPVGERSLDLGSRDAVAVGRIVGNGVECVARRQVRGRRGCRGGAAAMGPARPAAGRPPQVAGHLAQPAEPHWGGVAALPAAVAGVPRAPRWRADQLQRGSGQRPCNRSTEIGMILRRIVSRRQVRPRQPATCYRDGP